MSNGAMSTESRVALAVAGGYLLGRNKKMKLAISLGSMLIGKRVATNPRALLKQGRELVDANPNLAEIEDQIRGKFLEAARAAALATLSSRMELVSDSLRDRTDGLRGLAGELEAAADEAEDEDSYDEDEDEDSYDDEEPEDEDEDEGEEPAAEERPRPRRRRPSSASAAKKTASKRAPSASAPAKKAAAKKAPAKKAPAKKAPAKKAAAKKAPAKKTAAKKTTAKKSSSSRSRSNG